MKRSASPSSEGSPSKRLCTLESTDEADVGQEEEPEMINYFDLLFPELVLKICEKTSYSALFPLMLTCTTLHGHLCSDGSMWSIKKFWEAYRPSATNPEALIQAATFLLLQGGLGSDECMAIETAKVLSLPVSSPHTVRIVSSLTEGLTEAERETFTCCYFDNLVAEGDKPCPLAGSRPWKLWDFVSNEPDFVRFIKPLLLGCDRLTLTRLLGLYARKTDFMSEDQASSHWLDVFKQAPRLKDQVCSILLDWAIAYNMSLSFDFDKRQELLDRLLEIVRCLRINEGGPESLDEQSGVEMVIGYLIGAERNVLEEVLEVGHLPTLPQVVSSIILLDFQFDDLLETCRIPHWPRPEQEDRARLLQLMDIIDFGTAFQLSDLLPWQASLLPYLSMYLTEQDAETLWKSYCCCCHSCCCCCQASVNGATFDFILGTFIHDEEVCRGIVEYVLQAYRLERIPEDQSIFANFGCIRQCFVFSRCIRITHDSCPDDGKYACLARRATKDFTTIVY